MKVIQVNPKYKLWYAFGLFAVFLLLLSVYYAVTRNITETLYNVPTWGIPCIFIYYIFIHRMKIMISDEKKLVYKLSYSLFYESINILEIDNIILEKVSCSIALLSITTHKKKSCYTPKTVPLFCNR